MQSIMHPHHRSDSLADDSAPVPCVTLHSTASLPAKPEELLTSAISSRPSFCKLGGGGAGLAGSPTSSFCAPPTGLQLAPTRHCLPTLFLPSKRLQPPQQGVLKPPLSPSNGVPGGGREGF